MTTITKWLNSPVLLVFLLFAGMTTDLVLIGRAYDFSKSDWASWVQAVGSIGAILGAFAIANAQHQKDRSLETERRQHSELRGFEVVRALIAHANALAAGIAQETRDSPFALSSPAPVVYLADSAKSLRALPLMELPHEDLVFYCIAVPRAIDQAVELLNEHALAVQRRGLRTQGESEALIVSLNEVLELTVAAGILCHEYVRRLRG